ncbi:hypothetical protein F4821DRAFT_241278 [Hypoxylon rubiginosum]|uniref:Uncharacterized protein n=1 Tax=Hypoxylon rubiginosum TaxID=110542 RepID=A0ACC0CXG6_9PEZI|nr:hypothetical protein F4821DRAFT_241278 [Hypoxylon rubiginosum]
METSILDAVPDAILDAILDRRFPVAPLLRVISTPSCSRKRKRSRSRSVEAVVDEDEEREPIFSPYHPIISGTSFADYAHLPLVGWPNAQEYLKRDPNRPETAFTRIPKHLAADLGKYISMAYWPESTVLRPVFNQEAGSFRPTLRRSRTNRIILYPGCFNPVHEGHRELLCRAYACTRDVNVIAAIVIALDNDSVREKEYADEIWLRKTQRAKLWSGHRGLRDWAWVYAKADDEWDNFQERLTRLITTVGFKLEYVALFGPDHVGIHNVRAKWWDCENMIVNDAGRAADFVCEDGKLTRLNTCSNWEPVSIDKEEMDWMSTLTAQWLLSSRSFGKSGKWPSSLELTNECDTEEFKALIERITEEYTHRMKGVVSCRKQQAGRWIRYIPTVDDTVWKDSSSTHLRRIIKTTPPDQLYEKLKGKALCPRTLVRYVGDMKIDRS